MCSPVLQLHSGICFKATLNQTKTTAKKPTTNPRKCFMGRAWEESVVCARGPDCCEEQSSAGAFCWIWASVGQQHSSPALPGAGDVLCRLWGWEQEELVGEEVRTKSSPCPGTPQLLSCSASFILCASPELLRSGGAWESLTQLHVGSCCGCRRISQEEAGMWF